MSHHLPLNEEATHNNRHGSSTSSTSSSGSDRNYEIGSFPAKIYAMLEDAETRGFDNIVAWQRGGKGFKIYQTEAFTNSIMKVYFSQSKFKSFQRQLNIYGWKKVKFGPNKGAYIHKLFLRGKPELCSTIIRRREGKRTGQLNTTTSPHQRGSSSAITDNGNTAAAVTTFPPTAVASRRFQSPRDDHGFPISEPPRQSVIDWERHSMDDKKHSNHNHVPARGPSLDLHESEIASFYDFFYPQDPLEKSQIHHSVFQNHTVNAVDYTDNGSIIGRNDSFSSAAAAAAVASPREGDGNDFGVRLFHDGDLDDLVTSYSSDTTYNFQPPLAASLPTISEEMTRPLYEPSSAVTLEEDDDGFFESATGGDISFPFKLYLMLENAERDKYSHIVSWVKGGKAFKVHNQKDFVTSVMPVYFDQSKYESFRRQLNLYRFSRCSRGEDRGVISHPFLRAGERHLCSRIKRPGVVNKEEVPQPTPGGTTTSVSSPTMVL